MTCHRVSTGRAHYYSQVALAPGDFERTPHAPREELRASAAWLCWRLEMMLIRGSAAVDVGSRRQANHHAERDAYFIAKSAD